MIASENCYWIHSTALGFTLNALGAADLIQCSVASGAVIQCFINHVDEDDTLGFSASHGYKSWKLAAGPTRFNTATAKYVYAAIPKDPGNNTAIIVYPSEKLDIYGKNANGEQIGSSNHYYIWLQGVISAEKTQGDRKYREWNPYISNGKLDTPEGDMEKSQSSEWFIFRPHLAMVSFLKEVAMEATSFFSNLRLGKDKHNLTGVATGLTADEYMDSDELVATPSYIKANYVSKKNDDTVEGNITFNKNITVGGNGIINGILQVGSWIKAQWAELSYIKSPDYTGDGLQDSGFLLTNNANGHSKLTVDELYVRMKAVFEELQIKKETVTGGNEIHSCAASIISFTRFINGQGQDVSFHSVNRPIKFRGVPIAITRALANTRLLRDFLSTSVTERKIFSATEFSQQVSAVRCYFLAKEGEQEIENWWQSNNDGRDLARCQTFNLIKKSRETYVTGMGNSQNVFWWRKVMAVSNTPVEIDGKMYHWFDVYVGNDTSGFAADSDIPAAGDHVSQWGNDNNPDRMNIITVEVDGEDAPAIKMYEGINTFSMQTGIYGNPLKCRQSPKAGYKFLGKKFELITEYAVKPIPIERGPWADIQGRLCYYYDIVQHNGATWLCVAAGNQYVVDESFTHEGTPYPVNTTLTQAQYDALTVDEQVKCHCQQKGSTLLEPMVGSPSWLQYAAKGEPGDPGADAIHLDLDNEHEDFLYSENILVSPVTGAIVTPRLYEGGVQVTTGITWAVSTDNGNSWSNPSMYPIGGGDADVLLSSDGGVTVLGLNVLSAKVIIRASYKGNPYYAEFTANKTMQDKYDLTLVPNAISYNPATYPSNGVTITPSAKHTDLQGTITDVDIRTDSELVEGKIYLYYGYVGSNGSVGNMSLLETATFTATSANVAANEGVYFELRKAVAFVDEQWQFDILDYDTIPFAKVQNGKDTIRLDLDNEYDAILYDGAGNKVGGNASTTVRIYEGANDVSNQISGIRIVEAQSIDTSTQVSINNFVVTVTGLAADGYIVIGATYKGKEYLAKFSVKKISGKDKFEVSVNPSAISVNSSETQTDRVVEMQVFRTPANGGERELVVFTWDGAYEFINDYNLSLGVVDTVNNALEETTPTSSPTTTRTFKFSAAQARDTEVIDITATLDQFNTTTRRWDVQDIETIPVARVANGVDGTGANAVRLDLDNEMDVIPVDANRETTAAVSVSTTVRLFDGSTQVPLTTSDVVSVSPIVIGGTPYGGVKSGSGGVTITWTIDNSGVTVDFDRVTPTIVVVKDGKTYTIKFVVAVVKSGESGASPIIMQLLPSPSQVIFKEGDATPKTVTMGIKKTIGNNTSVITIAESGLNVRFSYDHPATSTDAAWSDQTINPNTNRMQIYVAAFKGATLVDRETIPIIKDGTTGMDAISGYADYLFSKDASGAQKPSASAGEVGKIDLLEYNSSNSDRIDICEESGGSYSWEGYGENVVPDGSTYVSKVDGHLYRATPTGWRDEGMFRGEDAVGIVMTPPSVIIEQDINNMNNIQPIATRSLDRVAIQVMKGTVLCNITNVTATPLHVYISDKETTGCYAATRNWNPQGNVANIYIKGIGTQSGQYYNTGQITLALTYTDPDTNTSKVITSVITKVYVNLVGTWAETIKGDTKEEVARSLTYGYDPESGNVIPLENFGQFIKSSEESISTIRKNVASYNLFTGLSDGEGWVKDTFEQSSCRFYADEKVISPATQVLPAGDYVVSCYTPSDTRFHIRNADGVAITSGWGDIVADDSFLGAGRIFFAFTLETATAVKVELSHEEDGQYYTQDICRPQLEQGNYPSAFDASNAFSESQIKQTANQIKATITNELGETGIDIENGEINLRANKVKFTNADGTVSDKISIDPTTGGIRATDSYFEGEIKAKGGSLEYIVARTVALDYGTFMQNPFFSANMPTNYYTNTQYSESQPYGTLTLPSAMSRITGIIITVYVVPKVSGHESYVACRDSNGNLMDRIVFNSNGQTAYTNRCRMLHTGIVKFVPWLTNGNYYWLVIQGDVADARIQ